MKIVKRFLAWVFKRELGQLRAEETMKAGIDLMKMKVARKVGPVGKVGR